MSSKTPNQNKCINKQWRRRADEVKHSEFMDICGFLVLYYIVSFFDKKTFEILVNFVFLFIYVAMTIDKQKHKVYQNRKPLLIHERVLPKKAAATA